jgi:tRNA (guanine-N7-)-methyltransferase
MRLRTDQNAKEKLLKEKGLVTFFEKEDAVSVLNLAPSSTPIAVEIGCGKGGFIIQHAEENPNVYYFAIEKIETILLKAIRKYHKNPQPNVHYLRADAHQLATLFDAHSVAVFYLNFSDPWPKARHEKRRLTHPSLLRDYHSLLKEDGRLELKTDNRSLFYYSLTTLQAHGFDIIKLTKDLYQDPRGNVPTEFEEKFRDHMPIYQLIARRR